MGWRWELPRPRFADSVLEERASLLGLILTITAVLLFVTFGIGLVVATDRMVALVIYGPITLVLMVSVALFVRGHMAASAGLLCAFLSLVVMAVVLLTGSPLRTYSGGFVPLMLLARGLLGRRVALVALCIYLAFLIGVSAAYLSGHYPPQLIPVEPVDVMLAAMMYLLFSAAFAFARTRTLEDAVTRARQATETERRLGAQAQALATLGSDALKSASDRVVDDALATILTLPGVSRAAVLTLDGKRWSVTTRGVDEVWARRVETHPDDVLAGRMGLGGEGLVESRSELGQKDGRVGVLLVGFADQAAATAAASFVDTVASLLSSAIDRERRESDLLRSQKRDAAGRLAANVTHDVNNLLASIAADAWTLGQTTTGPAKEIAEQVLQATRRGALLTGRLRMLSGNTSPKPERLSIDRALAELVEELRRRHVPELEVELAIGPGQHVAELDRGDLDQILQALTSNALLAMPQGGRLRFELASERDAAEIRLTVKDDGVGMSEATRERLFEPFFTTRADATGLGLVLTREILDRHGGRIDISSAPGQGTTVVVRFQAVERQSLRRATPTAPALSIAGLAATREILVVDDDARVRRSVARLLAREGYVVLEAEDGLAALALLGQRDTVGLVLSDVVMPRLGGVELAQRVQVEHGLPVLLMSGYFDAQGADPALPIVAKPFVPAELLAAVARVLGRPAPAPSEASAAAEAREAREDGQAVVVAAMLHDIANALAVVVPGAELLRELGPRDDKLGPIAEDIHEAALSCVAMTRQALRLASPRARPEPVSLIELAQGLERPLKKLVGRRGRLALELPPSVRSFVGDRGTLERALVNLVVNARDALAGGGVVTISVKDDGGPHVSLAVSDNGRGIDPDVLPHIFEPFFSTKGEDGYGLGLTVVKAAVEALGGHIDVSSTPGVMTTFRLDFPIAAAAASA